MKFPHGEAATAECGQGKYRIPSVPRLGVFLKSKENQKIRS